MTRGINMLISDFTVKCDNCGKEWRVSSDSLGLDWASANRSMGTEVQHIFYGETECQCGNILSYKIVAVEYPEGAYDFHECESDGCTFVDEPDVEMEYELPESVISLYKQILLKPDLVYDLEPWEFESLVADVFRSHGYNANVTQRTRDGGKDIVADFEMGGVLYTTYFECKRYNPGRPVGVNVVRELYAVLQKECVDKGVIVTTSYFTRDAKEEVKQLNGRIKLIDYAELRQLMRQ